MAKAFVPKIPAEPGTASSRVADLQTVAAVPAVDEEPSLEEAAADQNSLDGQDKSEWLGSKLLDCRSEVVQVVDMSSTGMAPAG